MLLRLLTAQAENPRDEEKCNVLRVRLDALNKEIVLAKQVTASIYQEEMQGDTVVAKRIPAKVVKVKQSQPQSPAHKRHVDRLAILTEEHKDVVRRLEIARSENTPDTEKIRALEVSLNALNAEIAFVQRQPVYEETALDETRAVAKAKPIQAKAEKKPLPASPQPGMEYEGWDVFYNFGRKDDAKTME